MTRLMGWLPEPAKLQDKKFALEAPARQGPIPPETPDRRKSNAPVLDQGPLNSCVGCAVAYGAAYLDYVDGDQSIPLYSPLYAYYQARIQNRPQWRTLDEGAYIRDAMDATRTGGIARESAWPYNPKQFARRPSFAAQWSARKWKLGAHYRCEELDDILRALAAGYAVVGGLYLYDSAITSEVEKTGRIPLPTTKDNFRGGHAVYFDRYTMADKLVRFQNSWGKSWGDRGYGYVHMDYLANRELSDDIWAMVAESPGTAKWT